MALYVKFECKTCENENCYGHSLPTTEKVCDGYKHTTTNADRIRAMTDEELAEIFANNDCGYCRIHDFCFAKGSAMNCEDVWLEWLKEENEDA